MATRRGKSSDKPQGRPATTPDGRENQLVSLAVNLAERQLREGSASAQVISHYLKLGSTREALEQSRLEHENRLLQARVDAMASTKKIEELYGKALHAMRTYQGQDEDEYGEDYDDGYE